MTAYLPAALRGIRPLFAVALLVLLGACAQPARVTQMTVSDNVLAPVVAARPDLLNSVTVNDVSGGKSTNPLWTSQVDNPQFKEALERSLEFNALLAPDAGKSKYELSVTLMQLVQPLAGFNLTVTSQVNYKLVDRKTSAEVYNDAVTMPFTADFSSSLVAVERLRLANEGAIRENIRNFLTKLGEVWGGSAGDKAAPAASSTPPVAPGKPTS